MGSGSGIISIIAASKGAACVAADINPIAVRCVSENAELNRVAGNITSFESDLFESLPQSSLPLNGFDHIFFNPPYTKGHPKNNFERSFKAGVNLEVIHNFFSSAKAFLSPGGTVHLIVSSEMDLDYLQDLIRANGFEYKISEKNRKLLETFYIIEAVI
jgi:release factor glutamine methyltransferase